MIPRHMIKHADKIKGTAVKFQDDIYMFYDTYVKFDWDNLTESEKEIVKMPVRNIIFRVPKGKRFYHDRYNDMLVNDRIFGDIPYEYIVSVRALEENIDRWMLSHYWTFQQKGFPTDKKWLKKIKWREYEKQSKKMNQLEKNYWVNRKTLKIGKYKK